jgi:proteic killer suppression protein
LAIGSIRHKGLKRLFRDGARKGVPAEFADKLERMLTALHLARTIDEIDQVPDWKLHPLKVGLKGYWSLTVTRNHRLVRGRRREQHGSGGLSLTQQGNPWH